MLEPQGTLFFLLLMIVFGLLVLWAVLAKQVVFRVLAACLAFLPAMAFGIAAVNKYYDYYPTWNALFSDFTNQAPQGTQNVSEAGLKSGAAGNPSDQQLNAQIGKLFQVQIAGTKSRITRNVLVWLPPQYYQAAYKHYRFPAIELLHGSPGDPSAWVDVMNVIAYYTQELALHQADPAVLVMPDTDGSVHYGLQCLNYPGGLQDMTFIGTDVPNAISSLVRVQPLGRAWGIAGYSEGGYCAANIGLQEFWKYGAVGSISGYFAPIKSLVPQHFRPGGRPVRIAPYAGSPMLLLRNTPDQYILHMPSAAQLPEFWLAAGSQDTGDVVAANYFQRLLLTRTASVPINIIQGGGHQAKVWRPAAASMLRWMTPILQQNALNIGQALKTPHHPLPRRHIPPPKRHRAPAPRPRTRRH